MTEADRVRWNQRYQDREARNSFTFEPSAWLLELAEQQSANQLRPPHADARALDLACGSGRNSVWLAERRWAIDAWDVSDVGLAILARELDARAARGRPLEVYPQHIDLDDAPLPAGVYDLVLNMMFLHRPLSPSIAASLRPGGLLVFQTIVAVASSTLPAQVNAAHVLQSDELRKTFESLGLETLYYDEAGERSTARLLARKL